MALSTIWPAAAHRLKFLSEVLHRPKWQNLFFGASLMMLVLTAVILYHSQDRAFDLSRQLEQGQDFERDIIALMTHLKDVETGARSYAITGNERYLESYRSGKLDVMRGLHNLDKGRLFDPHQHSSIDQLKTLSLARVKRADELVAYIRTRGPRIMRDDHILIYVERGEAIMGKIRTTAGQILTLERVQNESRKIILNKQLFKLNLTTFFFIAFIFIILSTLFIIKSRELRRRIEIESELKSLAMGLEDRVRTGISELQKSKEFLDLVLEHIPDTVCLIDIEDDHRYVLWNHLANHQKGSHSSEVIGTIAYASFPAETAALLRAEDERVMASCQPATKVEELPTPFGTRTIEYRRIPVLDHEGRWRHLLGIVRDITDQRNLELQIRQIQRLDAIGQLTGGIAHDFNNLLAIILGNCDLLREQIADGSESMELANEVIAAAERGAILTRRLLAFARQQHLEPKAIDLNDRLPETVDLIKRTLGDDISIKVKQGTDLWLALVDPTQVDDALINLAINARDAMPGGGHLVIETANAMLDEVYAAAHAEVQSGEYVLLSVSDTGAGMTPEIIARAFEPFYTTKDVGKGTGLGLSQVYGWVKQSGGHIKIYSEVGHGTTIKLYLPRAESHVQSNSYLTVSLEPAPTGTETILVVEDNPNLRRVVLHQLRDLGYSTLEAEDARAALRMVEAGVTFDLLLTDVVMPGGMTGYELAKTVTASRPEIKVILTSGYTELAARIGNGDFDRYPVLSKPYRKEELARVLRSTLDE